MPKLELDFIAPTATDTPTSTPTDTPTATPTLTPTAAPTEAATPVETPTLSPSAVPLPDLPTFTPDPNLRAANVPILLYHYIRPYPDRSLDPLGYNLSVPPDLFDQEMGYLRELGITTIHMADLVSFLRTGAPALPPRAVVVTFDDGYADGFINALPILKKYGMVGTFFIVTNFVEQVRANYLTWAQVKDLRAAGMEIGAHTLDHVDLTNRPLSAAENEIAQSGRMLEAQLGEKIPLFAYPYGRFNLQIEQITAKYFSAAASTIAGTRQTTQILYELRRVEVNGSWSFTDFTRIINYWMSGPR